MGLYQRLLHTVSLCALNDGEPYSNGDVTESLARALRRQPPRSSRADRLLRTPLVFETLEPRVLLSSDPFTAAAQNLLVGLQAFETWS